MYKPSERYPISHSDSLNGSAMLVTKSPFLSLLEFTEQYTFLFYFILFFFFQKNFRQIEFVPSLRLSTKEYICIIIVYRTYSKLQEVADLFFFDFGKVYCL